MYPQPTTGIGVPARIGLDIASTTLAIDDTHQTTATITDVEGTPVSTSNPITFTSQDPSVASVSSSGLITALSPGRTKVFVAFTPAAGVEFNAEVLVLVSPPYPAAPPFAWLGRHWDGTQWVGEDIYPAA